MKSRARQFTVAGNLLLFAVEAMDGYGMAWGGEEQGKGPCRRRRVGTVYVSVRETSKQSDKARFVTREGKSEAAQCLGGIWLKGPGRCELSPSGPWVETSNSCGEEAAAALALATTKVSSYIHGWTKTPPRGPSAPDSSSHDVDGGAAPIMYRCNARLFGFAWFFAFWRGGWAGGAYWSVPGMGCILAEEEAGIGGLEVGSTGARARCRVFSRGEET
ncbi:hypothetical protein GGI42DRAFT_151426 [Trichoderma sp. SZMC 28013]